jgi:hypothetical protein
VCSQSTFPTDRAGGFKLAWLEYILTRKTVNVLVVLTFRCINMNEDLHLEETDHLGLNGVDLTVQKYKLLSCLCTAVTLWIHNKINITIWSIIITSCAGRLSRNCHSLINSKRKASV